MHGTAQDEVGLHVPLQIIQHLAAALKPFLKQRVVVYVIQDREPVPRRCLGIRAVSPELGQDPGIVPARNDLRGTCRRRTVPRRNKD